MLPLVSLRALRGVVGFREDFVGDAVGFSVSDKPKGSGEDKSELASEVIISISISIRGVHGMVVVEAPFC